MKIKAIWILIPTLLLMVAMLNVTPVFAGKASDAMLTDNRLVDIKMWRVWSYDPGAPALDFSAVPLWNPIGEYSVNAPGPGGEEPQFSVEKISPNEKVMHDKLGFYYGPVVEKKYALVYDNTLDLYVSKGCVLCYEYPVGTPKRVAVQAYMYFDDDGMFVWAAQRADYFQEGADGEWEWFITNYYITYLTGQWGSVDTGMAQSFELGNPGAQS